MGLLIRGGLCVTASGERRADIRCREGRIVEVEEGLEPQPSDAEPERVLEAGGLLVLPGGVDPHVHMALPVAGTVSADDFESGSVAALAGGTTTIIDFVHPERGQLLLEALANRLDEAQTAACDFGLHMAIVEWDELMAEQMQAALTRGLPSFKVYLAYRETVGLDDRDLVEVLRAAAELEALVIAHAEHGDMIELLRDQLAAEIDEEAMARLGPRLHARSRPFALEGEATNRIAVLAGVADASLYVVHVTSRDAIEAIARARSCGLAVSGETCPQYLLLDETAYESDDTRGSDSGGNDFDRAAAYVIAPPLRPADHQEALWQALADGTLEVVATDHCPFTSVQKRLGIDDFRRIPGGAAGVEHRLELLYTHGVVAGRIDRSRFVDLVSTQPARRFGLYPHKGSLAPGADADLVLWDEHASGVISASSHHQRTDRSIYEGFEVTGRPVTVIAHGRVVKEDGELTPEPGAGRFLPRRLRRPGS